MFPKNMNDNNFYTSPVSANKRDPLQNQDDHYRAGQQFARRARLPRIAGHTGLFFPLAGVMVSQPINGAWWLALVGWSFIWPHMAWQLAIRASDPLAAEINNLRADAILAGLWMGLIGMNMMPSAVLAMMVGVNLMGAGGPKLCGSGIILLIVASLVTLQLTGIAIAPSSAPLEWWLSLPFILIYPVLFAWVSYCTTSRLAEQKRRLQLMSTRDGMTGVFNRRHWEILLRNEYDNCRRHQQISTLLLIDIDHFKTINDTCGHDVGDEAIIALTRHLQLTLRGSDVIGRFGGDEFAVIMSGTTADSAIAAMGRVHARLENFLLPCEPQMALRISVGVSPLTPEMSNYREWLKTADVALYKAKNAGRNRTEVAA
nr:diguanylate cyclase AdrA [uncultured Enterobacter sp.]